MTLEVMKSSILDGGAVYARKVRKLAAKRLVVDIISSPGAGKTLLLERIIPLLLKKGLVPVVIEGDCCTSRDGERISRLGVDTVQVNTGSGCHMDSRSVYRALKKFDLEKAGIVLIENVGNLICPAEFDLGEDMKVVVMSAAEGDDKPAKYPGALRASEFVVLNKTDIIRQSSFDKKAFYGYIEEIKPNIDIIEASCRTGAGTAAVCRRLLTAALIKKAPKEAR